MAFQVFGSRCTASSTVLLAVAILSPSLAAGVAPWSLWKSADQQQTDDLDSSLRAAFQSFQMVASHQPNQHQHFQRMREMFNHTFAALPKNSKGRIAPRAIRHILYTYFAKRHGWLLKGLEYHGNARSSSKALHEISIIQHKAPMLKNVLLQARLLEHGLSLDEVVSFAITLETLVNDEGLFLLQKAYKLSKLSGQKWLKLDDLRRVLSMYVILLTEPHAAKTMQTKAQGAPEWQNVANFVEDAIQATIFSGRLPVNPFLPKPFSFSHSWRIAEVIGKRMPRYQNEDCVDMKRVLVDLDTAGHGRVPLKAFYSERASKSGYGFVESAPYLRKIGALDETDPRDPRVLVANYVKGPSNCIVVSQHQLVCCLSECADLMGEVERRVGAPTASPESLIEIVSGMSSATVKGPRELGKPLLSKIQNIAARHGGKVPLHGRLFAQWFHFVFPYECPYPQIIESASGLNTPPSPTDKIGEKEKKRAVKKNRVRKQEFMLAWDDLEVLPLESDILKTEEPCTGIMFQIWITGIVLLFGYYRLGAIKRTAIQWFNTRSWDKKSEDSWIAECEMKSSSGIGEREVKSAPKPRKVKAERPSRVNKSSSTADDKSRAQNREEVSTTSRNKKKNSKMAEGPSMRKRAGVKPVVVLEEQEEAGEEEEEEQEEGAEQEEEQEHIEEPEVREAIGVEATAACSAIEAATDEEHEAEDQEEEEEPEEAEVGEEIEGEAAVAGSAIEAATYEKQEEEEEQQETSGEADVGEEIGVEVGAAGSSVEAATTKVCEHRTGPFVNMTPSTSIASAASDRSEHFESESCESELNSSRNNDANHLAKSKHSPSSKTQHKGTKFAEGAAADSKKDHKAEQSKNTPGRQFPPPPISRPPPPPPLPPRGALVCGDPLALPSLGNPGPPPGLEMPCLSPNSSQSASEPLATPMNLEDLTESTAKKSNCDCSERLPPGLGMLGALPLGAAVQSLDGHSSGNTMDPSAQAHDAGENPANEHSVRLPPGLELLGPLPLGVPADTADLQSSSDPPAANEDAAVLVAQMQDIAEELRRERMARKRLEGILREKAIGRKSVS